MKLLTHTLFLLDHRSQTLKQIAEGAGVEYEWLTKFVQRKIKNPGVVGIQAVHDYLLRQVACDV